MYKQTGIDRKKKSADYKITGVAKKGKRVKSSAHAICRRLK